MTCNLYSVFSCASCFFLSIMPAQLKNPMVMIASYPPAVKERVRQLPPYRDHFFHLKGALKGTVLRLIMASLCASLLRLFL